MDFSRAGKIHASSVSLWDTRAELRAAARPRTESSLARRMSWPDLVATAGMIVSCIRA